MGLLPKPRIRGLFNLRLLILWLLLAIVGIAQPVGAIMQGGATMIYTEDSQNQARWREYRPLFTGWTGQFTIPTTGDVPQYNIIKASPTTTEMIAGVMDNSGVLTIFRWDGYAWTSQWTQTVGGPGTSPRFDIAYEYNSGQALVVYGRNTTTSNELGYRVWNGSSWTSNTSLTSSRTDAVIAYVKLTSWSASGHDDIGMVYVDNNFVVSANWWNGSSNSWGGEPSAALSTSVGKAGGASQPNCRSVDVAFENTSGDMLVTWGDDGTTDLKYITRGTGSGGSWGSSSTLTAFNGDPTDSILAAEPGTNYIGYVNAYNSSVDGVTWNGSSWGTSTVIDSSVNNAAASTTNISLNWLESGPYSQLVLTYDDSSAQGLDWATYDKSTDGWTVQTDYNASPTIGGNNDIFHGSETNPFDQSEMLAWIVDNGDKLGVRKASLSANTGTISWTTTEPNSSTYFSTTILDSKAGWSVGYAFYLVAPAQGLSVSILDAAHQPVGSPSVSFSSITASGNCQTSTGTLGTSSQTIHIENETSSPSWNLSIAATGGTPSNWSSGTYSYDYDDQTSSGCVDGNGDLDTLAGQLSIDPSGGTLTAAPWCSTFGVSLGSSSAFSSALHSVTLMSSPALGASTDCFWEYVGAALSQTIPTVTPPGTYSLPMTLTMTSS